MTLMSLMLILMLVFNLQAVAEISSFRSPGPLR
jgi:hypothetical protein